LIPTQIWGPDSVVARGSKRLAPRFYQLKTGHCLTGQYPHWTRNRPTAECWWCRRLGITLTRTAPSGSPQERNLWAVVLKETGRGKSEWRIRESGISSPMGDAVRRY